jgi:hypothetical protein
MSATEASERLTWSDSLQWAFALLWVFVLSALAALEPMLAATFEGFNPVRQGATLSGILILLLLLDPRMMITRELSLYGVFTAYMFITLIWAPSFDDGMNTLLPAVDFILLSLVFGTLVAYHNIRAVLIGTLTGFLVGALVYTRVTGFPFVWPDQLSYNAIAGMYLFGLFITLVIGWYTHARLMTLLLALVIMVHIAATTSIKTNLGIALGAGCAALAYIGSFGRILWRNVVPLTVLAGLIVYSILANEQLLSQVQNGLERISRGVDILQRREDRTGHTSFGERVAWERQGIAGWEVSPVLGNGVEAFRTDNGITSHSTPIDLLYNFGVLGLLLFYGIFGSIVLRLVRLPKESLGGLPPLIFGGLVCYVFISLSGTMHYNAFMAVFMAVSVSLLRRLGPSAQDKTTAVASS